MLRTHAALGPVVMSRQNLAQGGSHPWILHACLEGAAGFATDALQVFGPAYRDADRIGCDGDGGLPNARLQHEVACVALQSRRVVLQPGSSHAWTFFGLYEPNHTDASSDADLAKIALAEAALGEFATRDVALSAPVRSIVQDAQPLAADVMSEEEIAGRYPVRTHEEHRQGRLLSFFVPDGAHNRHVVLRDKERQVARRHGTLLRSGQGMLPDEATMCATGWMHGVFGAQLTIGNTSFHKLFSVSRDPYNITRASGLRILVEIDAAWRLLAVPSAFDMGLSDCRWIYRLGARTITVHAVAAGDEPAMQWQIAVEGQPCRFLVFGHLVLGERELDHAGRVEIDATGSEVTFRPDPASLLGQRYPDAVYHLVVSTPDTLEEIGGDELLYTDGCTRGGGYVVLQTRATGAFGFAVVGSLRDAAAAKRLAAKYACGADSSAMLAPAARYWEDVTRGLRITGQHADIAALNTMFPWLAHNAMMHLTVPHGLEQYSGAAWGTRDVCQGPVEFFLALEHDAPVKDILRIVFAQQYAERGDWPQWFMLEPYSSIQDRHCHGDVIVWPLKALCDYLECDQRPGVPGRARRLARRRRPGADATLRPHHCARRQAARHPGANASSPARSCFRYGDGDWNDSLQPADPKLREWMVSSWTVALLFQQINRYARGAAPCAAHRQGGGIGASCRGDARRLPSLPHPRRDRRRLRRVRSARRSTPSCCCTRRDTTHRPQLFAAADDARHHRRAVHAGAGAAPSAAHSRASSLSRRCAADGQAGAPTAADRSSSSAAPSRRRSSAARSASCMSTPICGYAEALAVLGEADALWEALLVVNPIAVTDRLANGVAPPAQRLFQQQRRRLPRPLPGRTANGSDVKAGRIAVDGGWRIYSSGPGLYASVLLRQALGRRRYFGARSTTPLLPCAGGDRAGHFDARAAGFSRRLGSAGSVRFADTANPSGQLRKTSTHVLSDRKDLSRWAASIGGDSMTLRTLSTSAAGPYRPLWRPAEPRPGPSRTPAPRSGGCARERHQTPVPGLQVSPRLRPGVAPGISAVRGR